MITAAIMAWSRLWGMGLVACGKVWQLGAIDLPLQHLGFYGREPGKEQLLAIRSYVEKHPKPGGAWRAVARRAE